MRRLVLVAGRSGQVARSLGALGAPDLAILCIGRPELDLSRTAEIGPRLDGLIAAHRPAGLVNAAAFTAVDRAEAEPEAAFALNRDAAGALARAAGRHGLPFLHLSSDYVFSGAAPGPYAESDAPDPLSVYGRSKLEGEAAVARVGGRYAILRTSWVFSPYGTNFLTTMLRLAEGRESIEVVADRRGRPTYAGDLAAAIATVLRALLAGPGAEGLVHVAGTGEASWAELAEEIFRRSAALGGPSARVERIAAADRPAPAPRPVQSRLSTQAYEARFGAALPPWQDGVARCLRELLGPS